MDSRMGERSGKAESGIFVPVEEVEMTRFWTKSANPTETWPTNCCTRTDTKTEVQIWWRKGWTSNY